MRNPGVRKIERVGLPNPARIRGITDHNTRHFRGLKCRFPVRKYPRKALKLGEGLGSLIALEACPFEEK